MKISNAFKRLYSVPLLLLFALSIGVTSGFSTLVDADEAVAVADLWYSMELNSGYLKIDEAERAERVAGVRNRQLLYLVSKDDLLDSPPDDGEILAYVIKYKPTGFVVVSGEDRLEPIIVFNAESEFRWDQPKRNFLRYFLGKEMPARWECLRTNEARGVTMDVNPNWLYLRSRLKEGKRLEEVTFEVSEKTIYILWNTALWDQPWPYNTVVVANNGNTAGVLTGCVATAMAIKMRFHEWPPTGNGSHSYADNEGDVQFSHSVNFGAQSYVWSNMPTVWVTQTNPDVANLMYHAGVAVDMDYEVTGSGASPHAVAPAMNNHFSYKGSTAIIIGHTDAAIKSIRGGLPVFMGGHGHHVVADGYRDSGSTHFHINAGWSGTCNGWYNLDAVPNDSSGCGTDPIQVTTPYSSPNNYIYVDGNWGATENGNIQNPFNTVSEGVSAVPANGHLWVKAGTYTGPDNVPITIDKAMTITSYEGTAIIGNP